MARNKPNKPRVFCIGWHKTGTSTIGLALLELGCTVLGARLDMAEPLLDGDIETPLKLAGQFDALQDVPWAALFKELDQQYPGSKFILTIREEDAWLNSATKHFKDSYFSLHEWLYGEGVLWGSENIYRNRFRKHYEEVMSFFKNRPEDLLIMDFKKGDSWEQLCSFLDEPTPNKWFPYANKGKHSYNWKDKAKYRLRKAVPTPLRKARVALLQKLGLHRGINQFNNTYENRVMRRKVEPQRSTKDGTK
jgi:hypothetical protein